MAMDDGDLAVWKYHLSPTFGLSSSSLAKWMRMTSPTIVFMRCGIKQGKIRRENVRNRASMSSGEVFGEDGKPNDLGVRVCWELDHGSAMDGVILTGQCQGCIQDINVPLLLLHLRPAERHANLASVFLLLHQWTTANHGCKSKDAANRNPNAKIRRAKLQEIVASLVGETLPRLLGSCRPAKFILEFVFCRAGLRSCTYSSEKSTTPSMPRMKYFEEQTRRKEAHGDITGSTLAL